MKKVLNFIKSMYLISLTVCATSFILSCASDDGGGTPGGYSEGKGGSMARFAIKDDHLYIVSTELLKVFSLEDAEKPKNYPERDLIIGFDIETIFPMNNLLFIGARSGMYMYDISTPQFPTYLSQVSHFRSCDPVVAQGNYAYVTLNSNSFDCGPTPNNVLEIYDVSDPLKPETKRRITLNGPTGLGIDGDKLFVCDGTLKVFEITEPPLYIEQIDDIAEMIEVNIHDAYDVIPVDGLLILVAKEGLFQFDYSDKQLKFVSKILINENVSFAKKK